MIRELARVSGVPLVDAARLFEESDPDALFLDGVHPSVEGQLLLARGFARAAVKTIPGRPEVTELKPAVLLRRVSFADKDLAQALRYGGSRLLARAMAGPAPARDLAAAERRFQEALRLAPDVPNVWLGFGAIEVLRGARPPSIGGRYDWLRKSVEASGAEPCPARRRLAAARVTYAEAGVFAPLFALYVIDYRAEMAGASDLRDKSLDPYVFTRDAYRQRREYLIYDGDPPLDESYFLRIE